MALAVPASVNDGVSRRSLLTAGIVILAIATLLRALWLTADPPTMTANGAGIVWHDEGPWVHSARNKALWGVWRTDNWNPVFLAPVFNGLEYVAFKAAGVGTWQARTVPVASGLAAVAFLVAGLTAVAGRRSALLGGALLATNYGFVMWNRAALMESTMTAFIVISWAAYAMTDRHRAWGLVAGVAAVLALFTKASAAFFVLALVVDGVGSGVLGFWGSGVRGSGVRGSRYALLGLAAAGAIVGLLFVLPYWDEVRFYNWQMSVTRKPEYSLQAFARNASWLPLVQDLFTWMWPVLAAACIAIVSIVLRIRSARPAERLLVLWVLLGLLELVVHDSGNTRRYVMFLPAFIALAALWLGQARPPSPAIGASWWGRSVAALLTLGLGYVVAGSAVRIFFLSDVRAGDMHATARLSGCLAVIAAAGVVAAWRPLRGWCAAPRLPVALGVALIVLTIAFDLSRFATWARGRQTTNRDAAVAIGRMLPPGTLVQGKLANGLALESRIAPVFIGHGFGNYDDRLDRDDARYILTYVSPSVGFESQAGSGMIQGILDRYPRHRTVATFPVSETGGPDRAALIDKFPDP